MKVNLILADSAQAVGGKLYLLGGGWTLTGPDPSPSAIAVLVEIPWDEANRVFNFKLSLFTGDDQAVIVPTPVGDRPVEIEGQFEAGRPPGLKPGTPLMIPLVVNLASLPLPPDGLYVWKLEINGRSEEDWQLSFRTRPAAQKTPGTIPG
jgi:hypothetical protein